MRKSSPQGLGRPQVGKDLGVKEFIAQPRYLETSIRNVFYEAHATQRSRTLKLPGWGRRGYGRCSRLWRPTPAFPACTRGLASHLPTPFSPCWAPLPPRRPYSFFGQRRSCEKPRAVLYIMYVMYKTVLAGCEALSGYGEREWVSSFDAPKQTTYTYTYTLGGNHEPGHHIPR